MRMRRVTDDIYWLGAIDWDRRLFDGFVPLPDGTSYNCYLVRGSEKTALIDTVDPSRWDELRSNLREVPNLDYVVINHVEQDHSGSLPFVLDRYPNAKVLCTAKARSMLVEHLAIDAERVMTVEDGKTVSLGSKTLRFIFTPWVHWPETMCTYVEEDRGLFSCDMFAAHLASSDLFAGGRECVIEEAKRYYAEIMMPFASQIARHLEKLSRLEIKWIATSHGPVYDQPAAIMAAYRDWAVGGPKNLVLLLSISMHGSTQKMVEHLVGELVHRGVDVQPFDMSSADIGKVMTALADAATLVIATPTVLGGPHPNIASAAFTVNQLKPKTKYLAIIGSYGWGGHAVDQLKQLMSGVKAEMLDPVLCRGLPADADYAALSALADTIAARHRELDAKGA
ncbi:MAG: FprA family A-type flavoprotein [Acidobacteriota bacterium]